MGETLRGRVALITGGGSGIGRACALLFAREGARVCAADLRLEGAAETVRTIEAEGGEALAVPVDVSDATGVDRMVGACVEAFGGVDILVAAAGIASARPPSPDNEPYTTLTIPLDQFRRIMEINFYGVLYCNRAVARWLLEHGRSGSIVNIASAAAKVPLPGAAYSVSKAGVWMLTKALAMELATAGIRVNAIGPGWIDTPMTAALRDDEARLRWALSLTPMGRMGKPEEVASVALFLASDAASYMTGELLHPSGGMFVG